MASPRRRLQGPSLGNTKQEVAEMPAEPFFSGCFSPQSLSPGGLEACRNQTLQDSAWMPWPGDGM